MKTTSQEGIDLIKSFEDLRLDAYLDSANIPTIGYGHTGYEVKLGQSIDETQAEALLRSDLRAAEVCVNQQAPKDCTQGQFDACVSFVFNLGCGAFFKSTLRIKWRSGDVDGAADQFVWHDENGVPHGWIHAGGKVLSGLVKRREAEKELFLRPDVPAS